MSDEGSIADDAASDGGDEQDGAGTALATQAVARPQRPSGKRSRLKSAGTLPGDSESDSDHSDSAAETGDDHSDSNPKTTKSRKSTKAGKAAKSGKSGSVNPFLFVFNYLKQVVAEMRKVIWPSRKQMITYTGVVLAFLVFMVTLVGLTDFGLTKLVMWVFGHG